MASGHTELLRQAREQQQQAAKEGRFLSREQASSEVAKQSLDAEKKKTEIETLLREVDKRLHDELNKLRIVGPCVSGNYKTGWAVNVSNEAGGSGDDAYRQAGQMFISGAIYDVQFLLAAPPVAV